MRALLNSNHLRHLRQNLTQCPRDTLDSIIDDRNAFLVFSDGGVVGNHPQSIANMVIHVCYDLEALCHSFPFSVLKLSQSVNQNRCDKTDQKIRVLPLSGVRSDPRPNQNCRYFCENEAADRRRAGEHGVEVQNILFKLKKLRE